MILKFPFWHSLLVAFLSQLPWTKSQAQVLGGELAWKAWAPMQEGCLSIQELGQFGLWRHCCQNSGFLVLRIWKHGQSPCCACKSCWILHLWLPVSVYFCDKELDKAGRGHEIGNWIRAIPESIFIHSLMHSFNIYSSMKGRHGTKTRGRHGCCLTELTLWYQPSDKMS